jgi:hypothetical protein
MDVVCHIDGGCTIRSLFVTAFVHSKVGHKKTLKAANDNDDGGRRPPLGELRGHSYRGVGQDGIRQRNFFGFSSSTHNGNLENLGTLKLPSSQESSTGRAI